MSSGFMTHLCDAVLAPGLASGPHARSLIARAIADTLAVAAAGFPEPVTQNGLRAYAGGPARTWSGEPVESREAAILINGFAAHALDFDDVYIATMAHLSTVLVPAILRDGEQNPDDVLEAFAAGMIAARAIAVRVGRGHYNRGWHGTGTIGVFGAAAAVGNLERLTPVQMANAFGLAASMSAGLQSNFSTQAKPAHAGFAAVAGTRAARLAKAGVTASHAIFDKKGYPDLYGAGDGNPEPGPDAFEMRPDEVAVKLYPCCFATHRLVGLALEARTALGARVLDPALKFGISVPTGTIDILRYDRPRTGLEAKFSKTYPVAVGLLYGTPTLAHFEDAAVGDPDISAFIDRIEVTEDPAQQSGGDIEFGTATLTVDGPDGTQGVFARSALPGSLLDPPAPEALRDKIDGCLSVYEAWAGKPFPILSHLAGLGLEPWLPAGARLSRPDQKHDGVMS